LRYELIPVEMRPITGWMAEQMPRLYIEEYTRELKGKQIFIACREGILRDHFADIISDIKFLNRQGVITTLFHNIPNRFANQKHFRELASRLPGNKVVRVLPEIDFYNFVLDFQERVFKLIFLERKCLVSREGQRINSLTTQNIRQNISSYSDLIANTNFKAVLERICHKIEQNKYNRVHILPAGKHTIRNELFTIEGSGTLLANNFTEEFVMAGSDEEIRVISGILDLYKREGFLKSRSEEQIRRNRDNFYVAKIDGIVVGCVEKIEIDGETIELGALAISTKFLNQRVGVFTINAFMEEMAKKGYSKFISMTNNPKLEKLYLTLGFTEQNLSRYQARQEKSPGTKMFLKELLK